MIIEWSLIEYTTSPDYYENIIAVIDIDVSITSDVKVHIMAYDIWVMILYEAIGSVVIVDVSTHVSIILTLKYQLAISIIPTENKICNHNDPDQNT